MKRIASLLITLVILLTFSAGCGKTDTQEKTAAVSTAAQGSTTGKQEEIGQVTLTVDCKNAVDYGIRDKENYAKTIPADGIIYTGSEITIYSGDTVLDMLKRVCGEQKIALKVSGSYVGGIAGLKERDCGAGSGWMYKVNGKLPGLSSSQYKLSDADKVEFVYTCSLGDTE